MDLNHAVTDEMSFGPETYINEYIDSRSPEELLEVNPRPTPIVVVLLIVLWLCVPFIASVLFLVVLLGVFATAENPYDLRSSISGLNSVGDSLGLRTLQSILYRSSVLWDASSFGKLWDQLLNPSAALQGITRDALAVAATQVDWLETGDAHVFKVDVPGLRKEDVKVELEGESFLQISGQRIEEDDETHRPEAWHRVERPQGRFLRRFQLPVNSKVDEVQAKVENGVLTVTVPKVKNHQVMTRVVEIW